MQCPRCEGPLEPLQFADTLLGYLCRTDPKHKFKPDEIVVETAANTTATAPRDDETRTTNAAAAPPPLDDDESPPIDEFYASSNGYKSGGADLTNRTPPHNLEAEQSVLGAILISSNQHLTIEQVSAELVPDNFYRDAHKAIYQAMLRLEADEVHIDLITLAERLNSHLSEVGGGAYLRELAGCVPTSANAAQHARIVNDKAILRKLSAWMYEGGSFALTAHDPRAAMVRMDNILSRVKELVPAKAADDPISTSIDEHLNALEDIKSGISFESTLDFLVRTRDERGRTRVFMEGLLRSRNVTMLCGRAWSGKTTIATFLARCAALEEDFLGHRSLGRWKVGYMALERNGAEVAELFEAWGIENVIRFKDHIPLGSPKEIAQALGYAIKREGLDIVIVDHLVGMIQLEDGNDYVGVSRALSPFNTVAKLTDSNIFLLHHQPKTALAQSQEINVMGSEAFRAATDCLMETIKSGSGNYYFRAQSRGQPDVERVKVIRTEEGILQSEGGITGLGEEIRQALEAADQPVTSRTLLELCPELQQMHPKSFLLALNRLAKDREIYRSGRGRRGAPYYYSLHPIADSEPEKNKRKQEEPADEKPEGGTKSTTVPEGQKPFDWARDL